MDAVARYRRASERNDIAALCDSLTDDAELYSPLSGGMVFRGHRDLRVLLGAVYGIVRDLRWSEPVGDGAVRVLTGECFIGPLHLGDAMVLELADDGRIRRIRPHLRPWLAVTVFAIRLGVAMIRHPGVLLRALRPARE